MHQAVVDEGGGPSIPTRTIHSSYSRRSHNCAINSTPSEACIVSSAPPQQQQQQHHYAGIREQATCSMVIISFICMQ